MYFVNLDIINIIQFVDATIVRYLFSTFHKRPPPIKQCYVYLHIYNVIWITNDDTCIKDRTNTIEIT